MEAWVRLGAGTVNIRQVHLSRSFTMPATLPAPVLEQIVSVLEKVPLFEGLSRKDLEKIAKLVRGRTVQAAELVFKEGDPGDKFYIVQSGSVEILKDKAGSEPDRLAVKRAGESFGEMALLTDAPRSASVRAVETANLLVVSRDQFEQLLGGDTLATRVMRSLAKSLRALNIRFGARDATDALNNPLMNYTRAVQRSLLPREVPQSAGFEVAAAIAQDDGGHSQALWDAMPFRGGGVLFAVLDAKGPGLPPAHLLAVTRALLREIAQAETVFERVLPRLNAAVHGNLVEGTDAYIEVGLVHLGEAVTFAIAGEQPAIVVKYNGEAQEIAQHGPGLGAVREFAYGTTRVELATGDFAVIFSESDQGLLMGAADLINGRQDDSVRTTAALMHAALMRAQHYRKGDDISFVIARKL
ncbi:MAG: cyclic nucleotide-binding domain-containing protein [Gemmatimonadota bacterium]